MNHTSLEIFRVVAEELSINRAARRVGRVQSNVTTRIQHLEEELDVQLFIRENRTLRLSPQGKKFLAYANKILSLAEEARQSLHPHHPGGALAFGAMECAAASRLSQPLAAFSRACPAVQLSFTTLPTRQLTEKVQSRELDCALVALPVNGEGEALCPEGLSCQPMFVERLMLLQSAAAAEGSAPSRKLAAFVDGCTYREIALRLLAGVKGSGRPRCRRSALITRCWPASRRATTAACCRKACCSCCNCRRGCPLRPPAAPSPSLSGGRRAIRPPLTVCAARCWQPLTGPGVSGKITGPQSGPAGVAACLRKRAAGTPVDAGSAGG
ncbi:HTH-type transcriptional regulator YofA [Serratia rubidaea]|uniref:HTH-type transcriptional regulator YofA n=2 Tax=Serratia rubidaea TaxID=61652 RepID=A0A4U9HBQ4_SERRU|nr:HTH-type transcriptional regulator YofA [Serratia rubidaea]